MGDTNIPKLSAIPFFPSAIILISLPRQHLSERDVLFHPERLSFGIVLPAQTRTPADVEFDTQLRIAGRADELGLDALWVRDVPLNSESYPDPIGHADPWVFLGALAATTSNIALATGAIVLPLRHPLHIAKAALSVAALSKGRLVLGLGSGDRPDAPYEEVNLGGRTGRRGLIDALSAMREAGIHHVAFNLTSQGRPVGDVMQEIARDVMPALK